MSEREILLEVDLSLEEIRRIFLTIEKSTNAQSRLVPYLVKNFSTLKNEIEYLDKQNLTGKSEALFVAMLEQAYDAEKSGDETQIRKAYQDMSKFYNIIRKELEQNEGIDLTDIVDDILIEGPREMRDQAKSAFHIAKSGKFLPSRRKKKSDEEHYDTYDMLISHWQDVGRPMDSKNIIKMLKKRGYTNSEIKKVFKDADVPLVPEKAGVLGRGLFGTKSSGNRNEIVIRASELIIKHGLRKVILQYLRDNHRIKVNIEDPHSNDPASKVAKRKRKEEREKEMQAAELERQRARQDAEDKAADEEKARRERKHSGGSENLSGRRQASGFRPPSNWAGKNESVDTWVKNIQQTINEEEKVVLAKNIVYHLFDYVNNPEWENVVSSVNNEIRESKINENFVNLELSTKTKVIEHDRYMVATYLLTESELTWSDIHLKPVPIEENLYRLDKKLINNKVILSE